MTAGIDGVRALSELTGLSQGDVREIAAQVKANIARLQACPYHEFDPIPGCKPLRQRYACRHCGGEIDASAHLWHERGRRPRPA